MNIHENVKLPLRISNLFKMAISKNKLAHAYLLNWRNQTAPEEIPLYLAKIILCNNLDIHENEVLPCNKCESCKKFNANAHPDLIIIRPDGNFIKINQIRDIITKFAFQPYYDKRVCIIFDCHRFNQEAANTILKTLEEPNEDNFFFLCTNSMDILLPTIISRCQPINMPVFSDILEEDLKMVSVSPEILPFLKHIGVTGKNELLTLKENEFFFIREEIIDLIIKKHEYSFLKILNLSDRISKSTFLTIIVLKMLSSINRDLLMICNGIKNVLNYELKTFLEVQGEIISQEKIFEHNKWINNAFYLIDRNVNKSLIIEKSLAFYANTL